LRSESKSNPVDGYSFSSWVISSANSELDEEWRKTEEWMAEFQRLAPATANKAYFSSFDYWWYDTNSQMFQSAVGSAAIAVLASAVVILLSSRSFVMTLFSAISVTYVLASAIALMVAAEWTLGFCKRCIGRGVHVSIQPLLTQAFSIL
jgi:predicted RND superfamily exporter protein